MIGQLNTRTKDQDHAVVVDIILIYDSNDKVTQTELTGRVNELRDFIRNYFQTKDHTELAPDNEEKLKQEIIEILNTRYLDTSNILKVVFKKLDVMEL